jgi:hypothetical protein
MSTKNVKTKNTVKPASRSSSNTRTVIVGTVVLLTALFVAYTWKTEQDTVDRVTPSRAARSPPRVPVITIHDVADTSFVQRYIDKQLRIAETKQLYEQVPDWPWPAVFRGTAVTRWTALRTWSASRLGNVLG